MIATIHLVFCDKNAGNFPYIDKHQHIYISSFVRLNNSTSFIDISSFLLFFTEYYVENEKIA